jgi:hypothetical protein
MFRGKISSRTQLINNQGQVAVIRLKSLFGYRTIKNLTKAVVLSCWWPDPVVSGAALILILSKLW